MALPKPDLPRIEGLHVKGFRALNDLQLTELGPLTVLVGPNGSGKSTVFDVFAFLAECFLEGLRPAWEKRRRFRELRTRGRDGPVVIELKYRERKRAPLITYHLEIDETPRGPIVAAEWLHWKRGSYGAPFRFLDFKGGKGKVVTGEMPDKDDVRDEESLQSPDLLAVNTLGQLEKHPRVAALRDFITSWHLSYFSADNARSLTDAGAQERLSKTGDNLANVVQYLQEQHPEHLQEILQAMKRRIPKLERVDAETMTDGRLLLQIKDAPFERPVLARFASDGTLKMLAYLVLLFDPEPPQLVGIEEPENFLHPRLLPRLAEECRLATARTQVMVTTHSPFFLNGLEPKEVWVLSRDEDGHTTAMRTDDMPGVKPLADSGNLLGHIWMQGHFSTGDPLGAS